MVNAPRHPYTAALLASVLVPEPALRQRRVTGIPGSPPNLATPPPGCRFHPRCPKAMPECTTEEPPQVGNDRDFSMCWWAEQNPGQALEVGT